MPFLKSGIYIDTSDKSYEVESSYYLKFQIKSALISIKKLKNFEDNDFDNKYQYYHYYTDHILYSVGQISNRFIISNNDKGVNLERKQANRQNFEFNENLYPILSDKTGRNTIEHIDEHDQKVIKKHHGVGGFNLIDFYTDPKLVEIFYNERKTHPYTLDLTKFEILIVRNETNINININDLEKELVKLFEKVSYVLKYLTNIL